MDFGVKQGKAQYLPDSAGRESGGFSDFNRLNMRVSGPFSLPVQRRFKEVLSLQNLEFESLWSSLQDLLIQLKRLHDCDTFQPVVRNDCEN